MQAHTKTNDGPADAAYMQRPIAALDIGRARIGVAIGDPGTQMALPRFVLERNGTRRDLDQLLPAFEREAACAVVVGLPPSTDADGALSDSARLARGFAARLAARWSGPVFLVDEAGTTVEAEAELARLGYRAARRRRHVDKIAAARILDRFYADPAAAERVPNDTGDR